MNLVDLVPPQANIIGNDDPEKNDDTNTNVDVMGSEPRSTGRSFSKGMVTNLFSDRPQAEASFRSRGEKASRNMSKKSVNGTCDIISWSILYGMWQVVDRVFSHMDAYSLENCENVCSLWKDYIRGERVWQKLVLRAAKSTPNLVVQNGWSKLVDEGGSLDHGLEIYKHTYWKMTNLSHIWAFPPKSLTEIKNHFQRSGTIVWKFLPSQRAVSAYNSGKGFAVKIHDQQTYRFRGARREGSGTVKKDSLCLDATDERIVVGGMLSQKVWVFRVEEFPMEPIDSYFDRFVLAMVNGGAPSRLLITIEKYINAESGVSKVQLHPDDSQKLAVLLPLNQVVEIWNIDERTRLQSFVVTSDSCYLLWQSNNLLLTAPLFSGVLMAFDTGTGAKLPPIVGNIRRIDAVAVYENLCATGENQSIRMWSLAQGRCLVSWNASKTFITALLLNDTMVISGSSAGIVKLWDLKMLLKKDAATITPLRRISMKGILHYPIKDIFQFSYTDLVIVAKYEANRKKDKIKVIHVPKQSR